LLANYNNFSANSHASQQLDVLQVGASPLDGPEKGESLEFALARQGSQD
jgi:hypothetical protein